jgi:hypothetical protein
MRGMCQVGIAKFQGEPHVGRQMADEITQRMFIVFQRKEGWKLDEDASELRPEMRDPAEERFQQRLALPQLVIVRDLPRHLRGE